MRVIYKNSFKKSYWILFFVLIEYKVWRDQLMWTLYYNRDKQNNRHHKPLKNYKEMT